MSMYRIVKDHLTKYQVLYVCPLFSLWKNYSLECLVRAEYDAGSHMSIYRIVTNQFPLWKNYSLKCLVRTEYDEWRLQTLDDPQALINYVHISQRITGVTVVFFIYVTPLKFFHQHYQQEQLLKTCIYLYQSSYCKGFRGKINEILKLEER